MLRSRLRPLLCLSGLLLVLAGCSSYEGNLPSGGKVATGRPQMAILLDVVSTLNELRGTLDNIKNPQDAQDAMGKIKGNYDHMAALYTERKAAQLHSTPEDDTEANAYESQKLPFAEANVEQALNDLKTRVPNLDKPFRKLFTDGKNTIDQVKNAAPNGAAAGAGILATDPPQKSAWMIWILLLLVLAACAGFLYRDGIWGNAVRLVNLMFAGLLAMNFYEPLAKMLAGYSEDVRTFTAFLDFLSFWMCFAGFAAIMMAVTDRISRVRVRFLQVVEKFGAPVAALFVGWLMCGIVLVSLHLSPLGEYPFLETFQPQANMFLGMFAPDREWLGFTKYQSSYGYCRSLSDSELEKVKFTDKNPDRNFIIEQHKRRVEIEKYIRGNFEHKILVNPKLINKPGPPAANRPGP